MAGNACDIGIIQVEIAERSAIRKGRKIGRSAALGADDSRATAAARQYYVAANAHGFLVEGSETHNDACAGWPWAGILRWIRQSGYVEE